DHRLEVFGFRDLADLDLALFERNLLRPLESFLLRFRLPDPEARDEFFGLRERTVDDRALRTAELHPRTIRAREETLAGLHHAGLDQLFVELAHLDEHLL